MYTFLNDYICSISFVPPKDDISWVGVIIPILWIGNWGSQRLINLSEFSEKSFRGMIPLHLFPQQFKHE